MKYIVDSRNLENSLYPKDLKKRAIINAIGDFWVAQSSNVFIKYPVAYTKKELEKKEYEVMSK